MSDWRYDFDHPKHLDSLQLGPMVSGIVAWIGDNARLPYKKQPIPRELRESVLRRDDFTCQACGLRDPRARHLAADHIYPESKGGATTMENLQCLCRWCNSAKGDRVP